MIKEYLQSAIINFDQTFVAIVKLIVFKALFVIKIFYYLDIEQINIKTVFLYDIMDQFLSIEILCSYKQQ